jgi:hypothetical protein
MGILTLSIALAISGVAAWYSIVGLMAIFSSAAVAIAIMGGVLEVGKLVTASWLYHNWQTAPRVLRWYLTSAVVVLMFITSMGIYGFLSKAHIDQMIITGDNSLEISTIQSRIDREQRIIDDANKVISQLDSAVQTLTEYDRIRGEDGAIAVRKSQKVERDELRGIIDSSSENISKFRMERVGLEKQQLGFEAEVGPIKYIAALFVDDPKTIMEDAVRWVILTIIFVFDPLAVLLLIAANMSLHKPKSIKTAVNVNNVDDEWNEIKVETDESQPEFFIQNEDPENTIEWSEELEPDKEKRKRKKSVANTSSNYGSITDIRKEKNEKALRENGTFGNVNKKD